jgi:capsule polysaccharide export protein KpsC/LpsZ
MVDIVQFCKTAKPDVLMTAVKRNGDIIQHIQNQTLELCEAAIKQNPWSTRFIKEQTAELCMTAVQLNGHVIQFIENQTTEICEVAIKQIPFLKNLSHIYCN